MTVKGMWTCKVCKRDFPLIFEEHYITRDNDVTGLTAFIGTNSEPSIYDAFDCPHCGCQNIMQERKRNNVKTYVEEESEEEPDEEENNGRI